MYTLHQHLQLCFLSNCHWYPHKIMFQSSNRIVGTGQGKAGYFYSCALISYQMYKFRHPILKMLLLTFQIIIQLLNLHLVLLKLSKYIFKQIPYFIQNHQTRNHFHIVGNHILGLTARIYNKTMEYTLLIQNDTAFSIPIWGISEIHL